MISAKEAQLNEFFENGMSPTEEQNFLISVAASDELRIAFKSHLELMRAVRSDKDNLRVAQVRSRTLAALGLSATAASQFLEHGLIQGKNGENAAKPLVAEAPGMALRAPGMQWVGHLLHAPALSISAGLLLGILSTAAVEHYMSPAPAIVAVPAQIAQSPAKSVETIPAKNGLHSMVETPHVAARSASHEEPGALHRAVMARHHVVAVARTQPLKANANTGIPEIRKENPGVMQSHKLQIYDKSDTAKANK